MIKRVEKNLGARCPNSTFLRRHILAYIAFLRSFGGEKLGTLISVSRKENKDVTAYGRETACLGRVYGVLLRPCITLGCDGSAMPVYVHFMIDVLVMSFDSATAGGRYGIGGDVCH